MKRPVPDTVKIYTRTGDTGDTSLFGGTRVSKSDARVDAYGEVDELNACLGFALASLSARPDSAAFADIGDALVQIQRDLFALGARLADPAEKISARVTKAALHDADVERLEQLIDRLEADLPRARAFYSGRRRRGGRARLHLARAVCRRAERRMVTLQPAVDVILIRYINRLSDLLFVMARCGQPSRRRAGNRSGRSAIPLLQVDLDRVEHGARQFLRHPLSNGAALDQCRPGDRLDGHIPPIAGDALRPVLEARRLQRRVRARAAVTRRRRSATR